MSQKNWDIFEEDCFHYLKSAYQNTGARFEHFGGSDSTVPDILCTPQGKRSFFIEAKEPLSQSGQFVVLDDGAAKCFTYSPKNTSPLNSYSQAILDYMNHNYEIYADCGTAGCNLPVPCELFYSWIEDYYANKGVHYFITRAYEYIIFPLEKFSYYFDVSAVCRKKKSGSSSPSKKNMAELSALLNAAAGEYTITQNGKYFFVHTNTNLTDRILRGPAHSYLFRYDSPGYFLIRRLSNTNNATVIFSISLKKAQNPSDLSRFEAELY